MAATVKAVLDAQKPAVTEPTEEPVDMTEAWKMAAQSPELLQALVDKQVEEGRKRDRQAIKEDMAEMLSRRDADRTVTDVLTKYADEIRNPDSEITKAMPTAQDALEAYLRPELKDTDTHRKLAYIVAAANNPEVVAKGQIAREKAAQESREAMRNRASLGGAGGSGVKPVAPKVDEAMMYALGMDPADKKQRAALEKNLKAQTEMREVGDSEGKK
jgi:hypothetical protein